MIGKYDLICVRAENQILSLWQNVTVASTDIGRLYVILILIIAVLLKYIFVNEFVVG